MDNLHENIYRILYSIYQIQHTYSASLSIIINKVFMLLLQTRHSKCVCIRSFIILPTQRHHCSSFLSYLINFSLFAQSFPPTEIFSILKITFFTIIFAPLCCRILILLLFILNPPPMRPSSFPFHQICSCQSDHQPPCGQIHFRSHCPSM